MKPARYSIGIDLGTTHSALSWLPLEAKTGRGDAQAVLQVPQLQSLGTVAPQPLLPSFMYRPADAEFPKGSLALPWDDEPSNVVGEFARSHGTKSPGRLVSSAKSWLCHPSADPRSKLLPFGATEGVEKISPLDASTAYLRHLKEAWNAEFGKEAPIASQSVVLTVPASFDATARDLTLEAAEKAGLKNVTLLEEPQAALYAWLEAQGEDFRKKLKTGDVILIVDVGGGTTDLSLVAVTESKGNVELERLAVGDHILLGGDNMDLALAYAMADKLKKNLDSSQLVALTHAARGAKERLYTDEKLDELPVTIAGKGSSLIGGTLKTTLTRDELKTAIEDGFFPGVKADEAPESDRSSSGLLQMGLPFARDAAITKHLAAFLTRQATALKATSPGLVNKKSLVHPTVVLFNGGVFKAKPLQDRVVKSLNAWLKEDDGDPIRVLGGADLDLAVARGAAFYGWVKEGHGVRIRGGTARAYYVGVESAAPAVPGRAPTMNAICVAPFGMEEGTKANMPPQPFGLVVGESTRFRFFASSTRRTDAAGDVVEDATRNPDLEELPPIETSLATSSKKKGSLIPVRLAAEVTELGALQLMCVEQGGNGQWKLELSVRSKD